MLKLLLPLAILKLALIVPALMVIQLAAPALTSGDPLRDLFTYGVAFGTTFALGAVKKYTGVADTRIGKLTKPVQPLLVLAASVLLPALIHGTPNVPDPQQLVVAPTATLLAVAAAEVMRRFVRTQPAGFR